MTKYKGKVSSYHFPNIDKISWQLLQKEEVVSDKSTVPTMYKNRLSLISITQSDE